MSVGRPNGVDVVGLIIVVAFLGSMTSAVPRARYWLDGARHPGVRFDRQYRAALRPYNEALRENAGQLQDDRVRLAIVDVGMRAVAGLKTLRPPSPAWADLRSRKVALLEAQLDAFQHGAMPGVVEHLEATQAELSNREDELLRADRA